ncbi:hypothetical protein KWH45_21045 [Xanthomonas campestris pv. mirabilis]|uniref:hypothetical protein n=1 Tax=Xanthomonas euvesicatoria TaxID=456327 RepID=UPI001C494212|nr:hypothetical protein [Xanthomonas euvesicatoria]MBV6855901.1 hypothetical protein [Xanthomonas campestris pv. mirabilis]
MNTKTRLAPADRAQFLKEVRHALDLELDPDDPIGHELEEYRQAESDAIAGRITPTVLSVARHLLKHVPGSWLQPGEAGRPRWQELLREDAISADN